MTDDQILDIVKDVDTFLIKETEKFKINIIDMSAIVNSRLRVMSSTEDLNDDFDSLMNHLNSQHVILPTQIH